MITEPTVKVIASTMMEWGEEANFFGYKFHEYSPDTMNEEMDELAEFAGRACYQSWERPNPETATNKGYLANILAHQHYSVLEHASVTFGISGVSRSFTHELVRHRHLSFSQLSQRYVNEAEKDFVAPPGATAEELTIIQNVHEHAVNAYQSIAAIRAAKGETKKEQRQAARAVLPNAHETMIVVSGNLRAWREVLLKRYVPGVPAVDKEFHAVATLILKELRELAPNTVQDIE